MEVAIGVTTVITVGVGVGEGRLREKLKPVQFLIIGPLVGVGTKVVGMEVG